MESFDAWLCKEQHRGLMGLVVTVQPGSGMTLQAIQDEVLLAEQELAHNGSSPMSVPSGEVPEHIRAVVQHVSV